MTRAAVPLAGLDLAIAARRDYWKSRSTWGHADEQLYQATLLELTFFHHPEFEA